MSDDQVVPQPVEESAEDPAEEYTPLGGARKKRRGFSGCLSVIVALAVLAGGFYVVITNGVDFLSDQFSTAEDFSGPGSGEVTFEVDEGDTIAEMGRDLKADGVVASVQGFIDAAAEEPESNGIQVGFYSMQKEMPAADAVAILIDPANLVKSTVTVPEGLRVVDVLDILAEKTDFKRAAYEKALDDPAGLGLPDYAEGNAEGYLFPATYEIPPNATAKSILKSMVDRWRQAADAAGLEDAAAELGFTPAELMTVASLIEAEGRGDDMPKISRVIYNRLEDADTSGTNGLLQIDATVNFALDRKGIIAVSTDETENSDSPYNTYKYPGLPPGPIEAPGDDAIAAAANPVDGPWYYYVTVDLATGETRFTDSYDEFLQFKEQYKEYCANESEAC